MTLYERTHPKPEPPKPPVPEWVKRALEHRLPAKATS